MIGAVTLFLVSLAFTGVIGTGLTPRIVMVLGATAIGWLGPNLYLYQKVYDRSKRMQRDLPDAIDLMTISVESGLAFDAAVQQARPMPDDSK